ncbi:MAG TPA: protein kinase [Bryobacteraceae bacterium]|jgi:Flp pilus assembly protein TadD
MPLSAGERLGPYEILAPLGKGGMGEVYRARDTRLDRDVAIKVLPQAFATDAARERFQREARAASALNHPHICVVHDLGESAGHPYLVMELLDGQTLRERIAEKPLDIPDAVALVLEVADALETAHAKGIIHRDIKPANIFINERGHAKVLDFGLAKYASLTDTNASTLEMLTEPGTAMGTVAYMSPEQARGQNVDAGTDLWSLGVVLYEMVTGVGPFEGPTSPLIFDALLNKTPVPPHERNPKVPAELERIISELLEKDRALRYPSAAELRVDLERLQAGSAPAARHATRGSWLKYAAAAAGTLVLAAAGFFLWQQHARARQLTDKDTIVLADFKNTTDDPVFDETLRQGLAADLEQSPFLSMISDQRIRKMLTLMQRSPDTKLTPEIAQEVCVRSGSAAVLEGSLAAVGNQYVLGFRARNCRNGDILDYQQVQVAKKEEVLTALGQIAGRFRTRAGESLAMVKDHQIPLIEATTSSLEALQAYSEAQAVNISKGSGPAVPLFNRAVELDPSFALASAHLGLSYSNIGESVLAADSLKKAYDLRNRTSDPEKFFISANYERVVTGNMEKAAQIGESWAQTYPRDVRAHSQWSGALRRTGRFDRAVEESSKAIAVEPDIVFGYEGQALNYLYLERPEEADKMLLMALDRKLQSSYFFLLRYQVAFLRGDADAMQRQVALARDRPDTDDAMALAQALVAAYSGRLQRARDLSRHAVDLAMRGGNRERAATFEAAAAVYESLFGNAKEAQARATGALELSRGRDVEFAAAFAEAQLGNMADSQKLATDLNRRFPENGSVQYQYLPALLALAALREGDPQKAERQLQSAERYDLAPNELSLNAFYGAMYPAYVRGEAFLLEGNGAAAAAEFQKLIDHRGIVLADPIAALARLKIAEAWHKAGNDAKAKAAYRDFLALWKDADKDLPILLQATRESDSLR